MPANTSFPVAGSSKSVLVWGSMQALLDEGSLYVATNPTVGTTIAMTTSVVDAGNSGATSAQTRPVAIVYNSENPSDANARTIYPLYWNFYLPIGGQAPTSATAWQVGLWLEPVGASAYTSGGSTIVPVALNPSSRGTRAKFYFGAITAAATTTQGVLVSRRTITGSIPVVGDDWTLVFGEPAMGSQGAIISTTVRRLTVPMPPIAIPPAWALKVGMWGASNAAAPAWEFECCYAERCPGQ